MEPRDGGKPLGLCGLVKREHLDDLDIGFALLPAARGKGYALEAARRALQFAKEELRLPRLAGIVVPDNTASVRVLIRIKFGIGSTPAVTGGFPMRTGSILAFALGV